jgi:1-deoxy-D-xylulose-5-phosphate reductoisomerase
MPVHPAIMSKKHIAILGSTGSIGRQALEVIDRHPGLFEIELLTARENADLLIRQAKKYQPNHVVIVQEDKYKTVSEALASLPVKVYTGSDSLEQIVTMDSIEMVLNALVGFSGLVPTLSAIGSGKDIALANKETLVVAGELVTRAALENRVNIYPVDSEHSAIFQCLAGEEKVAIEKIILTASGGPFRGQGMDFLRTVTREQALKHPNWCMGDKVTIDSASLMNKGLEVIEARWLFNLKHEQIEVVVHPQSIIHSIVQFHDGSMKAQMGIPDMRIPIQYALGFPYRLRSPMPRFSFSDYPNLSFEAPDIKKFRNLALAFEALRLGGHAPCILNAANEVVVQAFLDEQLGFLDMPRIIEQTLEKVSFIDHPSFRDFLETDRESRRVSLEMIRKKH